MDTLQKALHKEESWKDSFLELQRLVFTHLNNHFQEEELSSSSSSIFSQETERSIGNSYAFLQKLLESMYTIIVPSCSVQVQLSTTIFTRIAKSVYTILSEISSVNSQLSRQSNSHSVVDEEIPHKTKPTSNCTGRIIQLLQIENTILDNLILISGVESGSNLSEVDGSTILKDEASKLFKCIARFLINSNSHLKKSEYIQFLLACRKIWIFLKLKDSLSQIDQFFIQLTLDNINMFNSSTHSNSALYFRFFVDVTQTQELNWETFLNNMPKDSPKLLSILLENNPGIVTREIIDLVQLWLNSKEIENQKEAAFIVKVITSFFAESKNAFDKPTSEVKSSGENLEVIQNKDQSVSVVSLGQGVQQMNFSLEAPPTDQILVGLGRQKFMKFWSDYFDLYEVLNEKQLHIIQPVLQDKLKIFNNLVSSSMCRWYFVILSKMIHHDNRVIVKEGLFRFLVLRNEPNFEKLDKALLIAFLDKEILPLLKDHVAWILSEPQDFFDYSLDFAMLLFLIYDSKEFEIVEKIVQFITQEGKCLSPGAVFFFVQSLPFELQKTSLLLANLVPSEEHKLEVCLVLITQCMTQGLRTVDKFMRLKIEEKFVYILDRWNVHISRMYQDNFSPACVSSIISYIGALSLETILDPISKQKLVSLIRRCIDVYNFDPGSHSNVNSLSENAGLNDQQIKGILRWIWLSCRNHEDCFKTIKHQVFELWTTSFRANISEAFGEHIRCLASSLSSGSSKMEEFHNLLKGECVELMTTLCQDLKKDIIPGGLYLKKCFQTLKYVQICLNNSAVEGKEFRLPYSLLSARSVLKNVIAVPPKKVDYQMVFVFWKLVELLPDEFEKEIIQKMVVVFEDPKGLDSKTSSDPVEMFSTSFGTKLKSEYYQVKFNSFAHVLENFCTWNNCHNSHLSLDLWRRCIVAGLEQVEMAGPAGVIPATRFLKAVLPFLQPHEQDSLSEIDEMLQSYIPLAWNLVFEMRRTEAFWKGIREFTEFISHPYFAGRSVLKTYAEKIFEQSETVNGLSYVLIHTLWKRFQKSSSSILDNEKGLQEVIAVCLTMTWAGATLIKNHRLNYGLWEYLIEKENTTFQKENFNFTANARTRILAIQLIKSIIETLKEGSSVEQIKSCDILKRIVISLLDSNDADFQKRYFMSSITHRKKQRIAQALLILQPLFTKELDALVLTRILSTLASNSPQPSVRYLGEWIIIRILSKSVTLWDSFFQTSIQCWNNRAGFGSFFASICLHTSKMLQRTEIDKKFFEKSLSSLTELVLGQHVTVRVYSQICFQAIFERIESFEWITLADQYRVIYQSLNATSRPCSGNSGKLFTSVKNDFYLQFFHPETHFIPEVIFIDLPRISGMATDELPVDSDFTNTRLIKCERNLSRKMLKEMYLKNEKMVWHLKISLVDGREMGEEVSTMVTKNENPPEESLSTVASVVNFQKKINPWKCLSVADQLADFSLEFLSKKRSAMENGLIVVASLIDRVPNLGGLCRSCEIFGVSKYVIPSLKILEDQQFLNLSVSAHNWVDIMEVGPRDLEAFLSTYSAKGYTILGVEQATESTRLNDFVFPRKSLLLLGNEKYGIPTNLIHLVEKCLEIPQVGIIRSLNVHVTGALCIWQYASQHAFQNL